MGLFGKSDKEKEREAQQAHEEARRRMQEAQKKKKAQEDAARARAAAPPGPAAPQPPAGVPAGTRPTGPNVPAAQPPAAAPAADGGTYTVKSGDNLSKIAKKHLGDANRWQEIYQANKAVIGDNPDLIKPGQQLRIPGGGAGKPLA
jgi:nucleoid-associated protein YgaU